jgi:hypothetical protein
MTHEYDTVGRDDMMGFDAFYASRIDLDKAKLWKPMPRLFCDCQCCPGPVAMGYRDGSATWGNAWPQLSSALAIWHIPDHRK